MMVSSPPQTLPTFGRLVGATLLGTTLVVAGLLMAYVTVATPLVSRLVPTMSVGSRISIGLGVWSFALIAGGGLLVAGTNRLALMLASLKRVDVGGGPAARALGSMSDEVAVAGNVVPREGRPIPELVIGPFGAAVVHVLPSPRQVRRGRFGWEVHTNEGWQPMDDPLDVAARDAERVRRWLGMADLDFVVRVHAALVVDDGEPERSAACAVITSEQIPAWIASLPRQRTLTAGRRGRLLAMAQAPADDVPRGRGQSW